MKHKRSVVTHANQVPEGFVALDGLATEYSQSYGKPNPPSDVLLYNKLTVLCRQHKIPSFKLMRSTVDKSGPLFVPDNWRDQVITLWSQENLAFKSRVPAVRKLAAQAKLKEVEARISKAQAQQNLNFEPSPVESAITEVTPIATVPSEQKPSGMQLLADMLTEQRRANELQQATLQAMQQAAAAMQRLEQVWSPTPATN